MSLINDALKRAKAAQQSLPPPQTDLHLRPATPEPRVRHGVGYALPVGFALVALFVLFFAWRYAQQGPTTEPLPPPSASSQDAAATTVPAPVTEAGAVSVRAKEQTPDARAKAAPKSAEPIPAASTPTVVKTASTTPADAVPSTVSAVSANVGDTNAVAGLAPAPTNAAVAVPPVPPPAPPKLQGVVFDPRRPSAVINGKTLFIGDRFGTQRVSAIGRDSVTLIGGGKTNVLVLEE